MQTTTHYKIEGKFEGKHRIMFDDGSRQLADDKQLAAIHRTHKQIGSVDYFPGQEPKPQAQTMASVGTSRVLDAAIETLLLKVDSLETTIGTLQGTLNALNGRIEKLEAKPK